MLSKSNIEQLKSQGKDVKKVEAQIENFVKGFPFMQVDRPAKIGDGIIQLTDKDLKRAVDFYDDTLGEYKIVKFVPASGAASRMFKDLFSFMNEYKGSAEDSKKLNEDGSWNSLRYFFNNIEKFAFYDDLKSCIKEGGLGITQLIESNKHHIVLQYLLTEKGLNYGNSPKGLLKFHKYEEGSRTPVEEHLVEGALYARSSLKETILHFTVSPEHEIKFKEHLDKVIGAYSDTHNTNYNIDFSTQKPSTDTIAVDLDNKPFLLDDGEILFRPGGHGALIENLNDLEGDIIFIKNIDNVVPDHLKDATVLYKKALAGILMEYQERIFYYLNILNEESTLSPSFMEEIAVFIEKELCEELVPGHEIIDASEYFKRKLNRPIRICGMVKNEGEPGGGPFWARNPDNTISLQVVESAQVDQDDPAQVEIANSATHFNPVDLICGIKNHKGEKFDLTNFVDPQTGFISQKSQGGRDLKALELPGLWNGSMSDWITIFVEVPIETFNPVKVVNDLLRPQHQ
jgi:hypothetical protein